MVGKLILDLEGDDWSSVDRLERNKNLEEFGKILLHGLEVRLVGSTQLHVGITK